LARAAQGDVLPQRYAHKHGTKRAVLEGLILDALKDQLMQPDLVKEFIAEFHQEINRQHLLRDQQLEQKRRELIDVSRQIDRIIDAIAESTSTSGMKERLFALEDRKVILNTELRASPPPAPRLHPSLAEVYRKKVADLQQGPPRTRSP